MGNSRGVSKKCLGTQYRVFTYVKNTSEFTARIGKTYNIRNKQLNCKSKNVVYLYLNYDVKEDSLISLLTDDRLTESKTVEEWTYLALPCTVWKPSYWTFMSFLFCDAFVDHILLFFDQKNVQSKLSNVFFFLFFIFFFKTLIRMQLFTSKFWCRVYDITTYNDIFSDSKKKRWKWSYRSKYIFKNKDSLLVVVVVVVVINI